MMNELFTPYLCYKKEDKIKKLQSLGMVDNVTDKGSFLLVQIKSKLEGTNSPIFKHSDTEIKCHEINTFAKEIIKDKNIILSELRKMGPSFTYTFATLPKEIEIPIDQNKYLMKLDKAIEIASERSFDLIKAIHNVIGIDREYLSESERTESLIEFLQTMVKHQFYAKHPDFDEEKTFKKLYKTYDKKFVQFWIKRNGITKQQMLCDHDSNDQFSTDGHWYNSVGICSKCLVDEDKKAFDSNECDTAYSYWEAALKNYKVKKEKI